MVKAYYLILRDLEMPEVKLGIQIGHGTDLIHENRNENYEQWKRDDRRKIILSVKSSEKLLNIVKDLKVAGIEYSHIWDFGFTVFSRKTLTGIVIHPTPEENLPKKVQKLQKWK